MGIAIFTGAAKSEGGWEDIANRTIALPCRQPPRTTIETVCSRTAPGQGEDRGQGDDPGQRTTRDKGNAQGKGKIRRERVGRDAQKARMSSVPLCRTSIHGTAHSARRKNKATQFKQTGRQLFRPVVPRRCPGAVPVVPLEQP